MRKALLLLLVTALRAEGPAERGWPLRLEAGKLLKEGRKADALKTLRQLMDLQTGFDPGSDERLLKVFKDDPAFQELAASHRKAHPARVSGAPAFTVSDKDLVPEGIAFDPVDRVFYMGCLPARKILRITMAGAATDFVPSGKEGLGAVLGLHVDPQRRILWAATETDKECGVMGFDLKTGRRVAMAMLPGEGHMINDLVATPAGDVLATDSRGGQIYRLKVGTRKLEPLGVASHGNGLALSPDGKVLFVSDMGAGILRVDLDTLKAEPLQRPGNLSLMGIDGLYSQGRTLLGVHNWYTSPQIARYHLDASLRRVERVEILERSDPRWHLPTTGAIAEGWFYYMANTQVDRFKKEGITPGPPLEPIRILKTRLDRP